LENSAKQQQTRYLENHFGSSMKYEDDHDDDIARDQTKVCKTEEREDGKSKTSGCLWKTTKPF
jgi:hypothetical protein